MVAATAPRYGGLWISACEPPVEVASQSLLLPPPTSPLPLHQGPSVTLGFVQRLERLSADSESAIGNRPNIISVDTSRDVLAVILIIHPVKLLNPNPFDQGGTLCGIIPVHGSHPSIGSTS